MEQISSLTIGVITLFPDILNILDWGVIGKARSSKLLNIACWNPRDFANDKRNSVDDRPYGGGPGMVMMVEPILAAINAARQEIGATKIIYLTPQGQQISQQKLQTCVHDNEKIVLLAGRYEGIDERIIQLEVDEEWSLGDIILSGGEIAAIAVIDAMTRLIPGVLGHEESAIQDSFMNGLLDYPHYTRPATIAGLAVPEVLLSGNHAAITRWRLKQALGRTWLRRPDLIAKKLLTSEEQQLLDEFKREYI